MKHYIKHYCRIVKDFTSFVFPPILFLIVVFSFIFFIISLTEKITGTTSIPEKNEIAEIIQFGYNLTEDESNVYALMFSKYAKKYNIDWKIYPAIITIESNWDPSAVSNVGARNLMQTLESTFKDECLKAKIPYRENRTIHNDIINLRIGLEYLSRMIKTKGMEKGVKSYIGGSAHRDSNQTCIDYYIKFKSEYAKIISLSKEYKAYEAMTLNRALNN